MARVLEMGGLTTVTIATIREHAEKVKPPRALFVPFAMGYTLGKPDDPQFQHRVIASGFDLLSQRSGPVLADFPEGDEPEILLQASAARGPSVEAQWSAADEVTSLRGFYERRLGDNGGSTGLGLSGVPQRRLRGVVRFLEAYARGEEADMAERSASVSLEQFIRYCADDLKAFFYEARMEQRSGAQEGDLHRWFWEETAAGRLIVEVAERMRSTDERAAFGIAR